MNVYLISYWDYDTIELMLIFQKLFQKIFELIIAIGSLLRYNRADAHFFKIKYVENMNETKFSIEQTKIRCYNKFIEKGEKEMKKTVYFSENIFYAKENLDTIASRVISALSLYDFASEDIDEVRADVRRIEEGSSGPTDKEYSHPIYSITITLEEEIITEKGSEIVHYFRVVGDDEME